MNNKMFGVCENCGQTYCQECTDEKRFCSRQCERESIKEETQ